MRREPKSSAATALIVHGVGPFEDGPTVVHDVTAQLRRKGIVVSKVTAFDWNAIVGSQSDRVPWVARAIFRLIRLRVDDTRRVGPVNAFRLLASFALQFAVVLFLLALILSLYDARYLVSRFLLALADSKLLSALHLFFIELPRSVMLHQMFQRWLLLSTVSVAAIGISEWLVGRRFVIRRTLRQLALILGWPIIYATVVFGYSKVHWVLVSAGGPFLMFAGFMALGVWGI